VFKCFGNPIMMFMDELGEFGVEIGVGEAPMVKNHKICDFCTVYALSKTVCMESTTVCVPSTFFPFSYILKVVRSCTSSCIGKPSFSS